jgi:hypothetical protein
MSIMSDKWIRAQALENGMIEPFEDGQRREGTISYGLSSYGYDARVSDEFKLFTNVDNAIVDPKDFKSNSFVDRKTDICIIPPNSFALAGPSNISACRATCSSSASANHLRPLRHHRERDSAGARLGRACDARILEHHSPPRPHLRQ